MTINDFTDDDITEAITVHEEMAFALGLPPDLLGPKDKDPGTSYSGTVGWI